MDPLRNFKIGETLSSSNVVCYGEVVNTDIGKEHGHLMADQVKTTRPEAPKGLHGASVSDDQKTGLIAPLSI